MSDSIPQIQPLTSWPAPAWATQSRLDGEVVHTRRTEPVPTLGLVDGHPGEVWAEAYLADALVVDVDNGVRVLREGDPVILLDGDLRLTLAAAHNLAVRLQQLVEAVEGADTDEPCASCGQSRDEHALAAHAFVSGDR